MCKHVVFTINNYTEEVRQEVLSFPWEYVVVGQESGESGTPHLQCYGVFVKKQRYVKLSKKWKAHFEVARGTPLEASDYCKKDGVFEERGVLPLASGVAGGAANLARWEEAQKAAIEGRMEDIPADINIRYFSNLRKIRDEAYVCPGTLDVLDNEWHWGESGTGKSKGVRARFPDAYLKGRNKWWCGYKGEETVIMEEVHKKDGDWLSSYMKIWSDHYPFPAEVKGSTRVIRPKRFIVTSNYPIEAVFPDHEDQFPIRRRFKVTHYSNPFS